MAGLPCDNAEILKLKGLPDKGLSKWEPNKVQQKCGVWHPGNTTTTNVKLLYLAGN